MIHYLSSSKIQNKRVLLRADFNVPIKKNKNLYRITDDERIKATIPSIEKLLVGKNRIIIMAHLGRPKGWDDSLLLRPVAKKLHEYLPKTKITVIDDFTSDGAKSHFEEQEEKEIILLENIRFFKGEEDPESPEGKELAKNLASLADVYVNDAFGVSHRACVSVTEIPKLLPHYGGILMEKEVEVIGNAIKHSRHPMAAIIGGAKISGKLNLLYKLTEKADFLILGGGIANTFLLAQKLPIGKSLVEKDMVGDAIKILNHAKKHGTEILIPQDVVVGDMDDEENAGEVKKVEDVKSTDVILDIGPESEAEYAKAILNSKSLIWNGPVGYIENPQYSRGTDFLYFMISQNPDLYSIVGGGDTLAAISKKEYLDTLSHISTGGGAMLEYIEKGTLPGIEALKS